MIMIKDNNSQSIHSLIIKDITVNEGQLVIKTKGKYRQLNLSNDETVAVKAALKEAENARHSDVQGHSMPSKGKMLQK